MFECALHERHLTDKHLMEKHFNRGISDFYEFILKSQKNNSGKTKLEE